MERPEGAVPDSSENDSRIAPPAEAKSFQEAQISVDHVAEIVSECGAKTNGEKDTEISVDQGVKTDADSSTAPAEKTTQETPLESKGTPKQEMSKSQDEPPHELENQFILRLPPEHASTVRSLIHSGSVIMKDKLKIDLSPDGRHAVVEVDDVSLSAKLVDLPCVIGSLKTLDKKNFYKTADISQMLVCSADGDLHSSPEEPVTSTDLSVTGNNGKETDKKYVWKHGITPPLKNVRKKRFRKTKKKPSEFKQIEEITFAEEKISPAKHSMSNENTSISSCALLQYVESPDVEKEVKRLLCSDAEAVSARWEVIADDDTKEIESQGCIPGFPISPGMSAYKHGHISEYDMLPEMFSDSSSNNHEEEEEEEEDEEEEEEDDDEDDEDEEIEEEIEDDDFEEALDRELQAKVFESGQCETKEGVNSIVMEIQKQIHYKEKKLQEIQTKAQRQKDLIKKVENLTLKSHLQSVLQGLQIQEQQKNEQLICLQEQLKYFLKK